jgi:uncharacterized protein (DUF2236 family)
LDPELLLWVHATLVDTALAAYERFVGAIAVADQERYHEEMKRQAVAFGVPAERLPGSLRDFRRYVDEMVAGLEITEEARELSGRVLRPPSPAPFRPLVGVMRFLTVGLLPDPIRVGYGMAWGPARESAFATLAGGIRGGVVPLLPDVWRRWPHARDADLRMAGSR